MTGSPVDQRADFVTEEFVDLVARRIRVFDRVVQNPSAERELIQLHVREESTDLERVDEVGLARVADLSLVLHRREDVRAAKQLQIRVGTVAPHFFEEALEPNHETGV